MTANSRLRAALKYARGGWYVFPLDGKRPYAGTHGHREATTSRSQIKEWWREYPDANVGIACNSQAGPIIVDVDGPVGERSLNELELNLPDTRQATSQRKARRHLYFSPPKNGTLIKRMLKVWPDLDILGDGGYVVAPPSIHPKTGKNYKWLNDLELEPFPNDLLKLIQGVRQNGSGQAPPLPERIGEGRRDELLTSLAGSMRRRGASEEAIFAALQEENSTRCDPPLPEKDIRKIARSIAKKPPAGTGENRTDLGNARRFIAQNQENVRSVMVNRRPWLIWEQTNWSQDDTGEVERLAKNTVRSLWAEASHIVDVIEREEHIKHASKSEMAGKVRAMLELAATEPEISITPDGLDPDPWLFNCENGTLDLRRGKLKDHNREDLITKLAPVEYDPKAKAPLWHKFLDDITAGDEDLKEYLQRATGYSLTGDTREECLFFCYGQGANGKTTFFEVLRTLMGDYSQQSDFNTFLQRKSDGPRNDIARMRGARLVTASEAQGDKGFDEGTIKVLTGNDTVTARKLYEEAFEFKPSHKLWLMANHKPLVKEQTEGFWRRMRLIPFTVTIPKAERIGKLGEKIARDELPGILNWAIEGCLRWRKEGLMEPAAVRKATRGYREENDLLGDFIASKCAFEPESWISTPELYRVFTEWWMESRGPRLQPVSMGWFSRMLSERAEIKPAKRRKLRGWTGIAVREEMGGDSYRKRSR